MILREKVHDSYHQVIRTQFSIPFDVGSLTIFYRPEPEALTQWCQPGAQSQKRTGGNLKRTNRYNRDLGKPLKHHSFIQSISQSKCCLSSTFQNDSMSFKALYIRMKINNNEKEDKQQKQQLHLEIFCGATTDFVQIHPFSEVSKVHRVSAKASLEHKWNTVNLAE